MNLWYEKPAKCWSEALPVGNGTIGGMVFGGVWREQIQLNEDSVWGGREVERHNPDARKNLSKIRNLLKNGQIQDAERLARYALSGTPYSQRGYQTAGDMFINMLYADDKALLREYKRELDLTRGIVKTMYKMQDTMYEREVFVSYPDNVMVIHLQTSKHGALHFDCTLERLHNWQNEGKLESDDTIMFQADTGEGAIRFCARAQCVTDGNVEVIGNHLIVSEASEATLFLNIATSYRNGQNHGESEKSYAIAAKKYITAAVQKGITTLKERHIADYQNLYQRVDVHFAGDEQVEKLSTDKRLERIKQGYDDANLFALYYQYGRYLMISSSRAGSLPANLQGIWNDSLMPNWDSKYTININIEMNYWLSGSARLTECEKPYFDLLGRMKENGKKTAKLMYGCNGSVAHHNTDIYADTAPQDIYIPATYWVMGEAWLATHIWVHYQYTKNYDFLKEQFDVLEQCVLFFDDFLIENENKELVTSPSVSPENTYILPDGTKGCMCEGTMSDTQILDELLRGYINACEVLGEKTEKIDKANAIRQQLPKMKIGRHGQLQEWLEDYEEAEIGHRHISHLYGVYPASSITWDKTPELMEAARKTLCRRLEHGGGHTGWSRAWIITLWARFLEGDLAYENFKALLAEGTFANMMDNHPAEGGPVFQIDGNFGAAVGLTEMLVQDLDTGITLLPALPKAWHSGEVRGLGLKNQATLDLAWENGTVLSFEIKGRKGDKFLVKMKEKEVLVVVGDTLQPFICNHIQTH